MTTTETPRYPLDYDGRPTSRTDEQYERIVRAEAHRAAVAAADRAAPR